MGICRGRIVDILEILNMKLTGRRNRGKPKRRFVDVVKDMLSLGVIVVCVSDISNKRPNCLY